MATKKVAVIMGSDSDLPVMTGAVKTLMSLGIEVITHVMSAHRNPQDVASFAKEARGHDFGVIIAGAGMAAHLAGAVAANTTLPVIGVPLKSSVLDGMDALLSTVMMPSGVPVATVAINGAKNAAVLAAQILAVEDETVAARLASMKVQMEQEARMKDAKLQEEIVNL